MNGAWGERLNGMEKVAGRRMAPGAAFLAAPFVAS
jgi:hypothetical protein